MARWLKKSLPANAGDPGDTGSIPGWRRSPGEGNGNPLQYSCLENAMDRGAGHTTAHAIPWTAACQASLSFIISQSLLKLMPIDSVMPSNHLILCHPLLLLPSIFPSIRVFSNQLALCINGGQSIGTSALASVLPMNIQG